MSDVFVTQSNYSKIAEVVIDDLTDGISEICSRVYGHKDISKYLNENEIINIECKRMLIEETDRLIERYFEIKSEALQFMSQIADKDTFVFIKNTPPKYHNESGCRFLNKDYINFYIPPEIKKRGYLEVEKFRVFANNNKYLLIDDKVDAFIFKLKMQFKLTCDISKISFLNSGVNKSFFDEDIDLPDISKRIDEVMCEIDSIGNTDFGKDMLLSYIYIWITIEYIRLKIK